MKIILFTFLLAGCGGDIHLFHPQISPEPPPSPPPKAILKEHFRYREPSGTIAVSFILWPDKTMVPIAERLVNTSVAFFHSLYSARTTLDEVFVRVLSNSMHSTWNYAPGPLERAGDVERDSFLFMRRAVSDWKSNVDSIVPEPSPFDTLQSLNSLELPSHLSKSLRPHWDLFLYFRNRDMPALEREGDPAKNFLQSFKLGRHSASRYQVLSFLYQNEGSRCLPHPQHEIGRNLKQLMKDVSVIYELCDFTDNQLSDAAIKFLAKMSRMILKEKPNPESIEVFIAEKRIPKDQVEWNGQEILFREPLARKTPPGTDVVIEYEVSEK